MHDGLLNKNTMNESHANMTNYLLNYLIIKEIQQQQKTHKYKQKRIYNSFLSTHLSLSLDVHCWKSTFYYSQIVSKSIEE